MKATWTAPTLADEINQCDGCLAGGKINVYGHHRYPDGSLIACTKDRYATEVVLPAFPVEFADDSPTDPGYEWRTIVADAQRAYKLKDKPEQACSWPEGSVQRVWWESAFGPSLRVMKP